MTIYVDTIPTMREPCRRRAGCASLLALALFLASGSLPAPAGDLRPLYAAGDQDYPPVTYLEDAVPRGFDVDVLKALAREMGRDLRLELLQWSLAQKRVQEGAGEVLAGMSITEERRKSWDFATATLTHSFSLFITGKEVAIHGVADLEGKRVGVKAGALPEVFLKARPGVSLVLIPSYKEGFDLLKQGGIDAVAADQWVGGYILNKYRIDGVVIAGEPFATLESGFAVAKGNTALLQEINSGLDKLRQRGAIEAIRRQWEPKQVVYLLKEEVTSIVMWTAATAAVLLFGGMAGWIITLKREVRVRRKAEHALRESEQRLSLALDAARTGIWEWRADSGQLLATKRAEEIFGLQAGQFGGTYEAFLQLVQPDDAQRVAEFNIGILEGRALGRTIEHRVVCPDGALRWVESRGILHRNAAGQPERVVGTVVDITQRKNAEEQIHRFNAELEQRVHLRTQQLEAANRELETFSYSVSHDLRAPLRSISGFGSFLLQDNYEQLDVEGRERLQRILAASERMGWLIDDLLKLAKISRQTISVQRVGLHVLAAEVVAALREAGPQRRVEIEIAPDLTVEADGGLMRVVLDNLLGNAWKFTAKCADARIEVGCAMVGGKRAYFVRDNGAGFDMSYAGKLFAPFQRMHTQEQFEGTGIGLATVKRIIERHEGRIWIEAAVDRGTTVFFILGRPA